MYLGDEKQQKSYVRVSKLGQEHHYIRCSTIILLQCDNCGEKFSRPKGKLSSKRLSNNYFHCCSNCDVKRFAQKKGVERRLVWEIPVSSMLPINRL